MRFHQQIPGPVPRRWLVVVLVVSLLLMAACGGQEPAAEPTAAAPAPTEAPAAAEAPAEEPIATAVPEEEPTATAEPEQEATATAAPEVEPTGTAQPEEEAASTGDPEAGAYIFNATVGCGCHFNGDLGGLGGGNKFEGPFGVAYSANISPHPQTGIGSLTDAQIADSIRFGKRADGENLAPVMPRFAAMADQDVMDLVAYLRSLEPIENAVPARELTIEVADFTPQQPPPAVAPTEGAARGQYLASLVRCGQCHTPRNEDGTPNMDLFLAGAPFRDTVAPNLTPDEGTGLGAWSEQEIADFLATGVYADGLESHAGMKTTVDRSTGKFTDADRLAMAAFLKSLPPIENLPEPAQ